MKNQLLLTAFLAFLFTACSKKEQPLASSKDEATVLQVRYACGTNCVATTWILQTETGIGYEPVNLTDTYKVNDLKVKFSYRKTGQPSIAAQTAEEKVEILDISRK